MKTPNPRRTFLKQTALAVTGTTVLGTGLSAQTAQQVSTALGPHPNLRPLAEIVLPSESLGSEGLEKAVTGFLSWMTAFEPVAELDHAYLSTDEISYGPPDPRPLWHSQLEALDLEAKKRFNKSFAELSADQRDAMARRSISNAGRQDRLPRPEYAAHIGIAIMAWYFRSSDANDLCYQARIGRHECRGMGRVTQKPRPMPALASRTTEEA